MTVSDFTEMPARSGALPNPETTASRPSLQPRLIARPAPNLLSVVAPAYNEGELLIHFVERVSQSLDRLGQPFEIVLVNDGSTDHTLNVMDALAAAHPAISVVNLSRNFGKEIALTAGLTHAVGDAVVVIDADLQDPPEIIGRFVEAYCEGYDMVYGRRTSRDGETWMKKKTAHVFYRMMRGVGPVSLPPDVGDFRLISRRALDTLLKFPESHRFMKGLFAWIGFGAKAIDYERSARHSGTTKWNYWRLVNLSIEGLTSFTTLPLRLTSFVGFGVALLTFLYGFYLVVRTLIYGDDVAGFPTLIVTILLLGGIQLIALGVIGEYLGRVFNETKRRPLFLVESVRWSGVAKERKGWDMEAEMSGR
jgi:glycosyltransferase involved in cell wall biosynthesis